MMLLPGGGCHVNRAGGDGGLKESWADLASWRSDKLNRGPAGSSLKSENLSELGDFPRLTRASSPGLGPHDSWEGWKESP